VARGVGSATPREGPRSRGSLLALGAAAALLASAGGAKELHWSALSVEATLEADGTLAVSEIQSMVFTGDWNGGERSFYIFAGQELDVESISRLDLETGEAHPLRRGDLDQVDHWDWASSRVVRWRSRRPEDPPFAATPLTYRLDYRLRGVLRSAGERRYLLNHDFAFAEREGVIERVVVRLALAPGWRAISPHPPSWGAENLPPGQGFVVPLELEYVGAALPAHATVPRLGAATRGVAVAAFLAGVTYLLFRWRRRERALGRFAAAAGAPVDRAWLEANVFSLAPEVVGSAWDRDVGSAEVAALLARLTAEGKLASEVVTRGASIFRRHDLHLRLLVDRSTLGDYERPLIDALFGASDTTDTRTLRERYRSTGFDPAAKIRTGLEARLRRIGGFAEGSPKPAWKPTALLLAAGIALLAAAWIVAPRHGWIAPVALAALLVPWLPLGLAPALAGRRRVGHLTGPAIGIALSIAALAAGIWVVGSFPGASALHLAGGLALALGLTRATFNRLATPESAEGLARRRELTRARDFLAAELRKSEPQLEDRWFPYLLAFGLAPSVDRWFRRFGDRGGGGLPASTSSGGSFSGGGGWTGGGGTFGGGGATATWAAAATAMSAGVASPSSSGGGGGGGGGSSGGGGGGGW
jgi:uncharacterized membrane protein YgcG